MHRKVCHESRGTGDTVVSGVHTSLDLPGSIHVSHTLCLLLLALFELGGTREPVRSLFTRSSLGTPIERLSHKKSSLRWAGNICVSTAVLLWSLWPLRLEVSNLDSYVMPSVLMVMTAPNAGAFDPRNDNTCWQDNSPP